MTEKEQIALVKQDITNLHYIYSPSPNLIRSLDLPDKKLIGLVSPDEQISLLENDPTLYQFIKNPNVDVSIEAVRYDFDNLWKMEYPDEKIDNAAVFYHPEKIREWDYPTLDMQMYVIDSEPENIKYIEEPDPEVQLYAVEQDSKVIKYIKHPTSSVINFVRKKEQ
jgi:hypothetical protein